jgi:hypothetical protein
MKMSTALLLDTRSSSPTGYIERVLDPAIAHLRGFDLLQLLIHAENVSLKQRQGKEGAWRAAVAQWGDSDKLECVANVFYDVYGVPTGPCEDWFKNIWLAFQDPNIDRIVYLPIDVKDMIPPPTPRKPDERLQRFIDEANSVQVDLMLGTYDVTTPTSDAKDDTFLTKPDRAGGGSRSGIRKNYLEYFTIMTLWSQFPQTMSWFCNQRTDPERKPVPRTGFFGLSRRLYEEFTSRPRRWTMAPWAGTVQLLLCAAIRTREKKESYEVGEWYVGELTQDAEPFSAYPAAHQVERIAYVIADERHYWSRLLPSLRL